MQIGSQNPELVPQYAPMMAELIDWWAELLAEPNGNTAGLGQAAQQIMSMWNQVLMSNGSLGPIILPCVLKSLNAKHEGVRETTNTTVPWCAPCHKLNRCFFICVCICVWARVSTSCCKLPRASST